MSEHFRKLMFAGAVQSEANRLGIRGYDLHIWGSDGEAEVADLVMTEEGLAARQGRTVDNARENGWTAVFAAAAFLLFLGGLVGAVLLKALTGR